MLSPAASEHDEDVEFGPVEFDLSCLKELLHVSIFYVACEMSLQPLKDTLAEQFCTFMTGQESQENVLESLESTWQQRQESAGGNSLLL